MFRFTEAASIRSTGMFAAGNGTAVRACGSATSASHCPFGLTASRVMFARCAKARSPRDVHAVVPRRHCITCVPWPTSNVVLSTQATSSLPVGKAINVSMPRETGSSCITYHAAPPFCT